MHMWKHYITFLYILIAVTYYNSCCECNFNDTDLSKEKRQLLEVEQFTVSEYSDSAPETDTKGTTLEISTSTSQYETTFLDINETTTESYESTIKIFEIDINKIQIKPDENNTLDNIFDISENSSEVMEPIINESGNKYDSELLSDNETTADKLSEREQTHTVSEQPPTEEVSEQRETEKVSEQGEIEKVSEQGETEKVGEQGETKKLSEHETENLNEQGETVEKSDEDLKKKCPHYKNGNSFKLEKMEAVWQVVYYRLPNKMKCFTLNIKPVNNMEQQRYAKIYGNFNDTVDWERCFFEITSNETANSGRRHFLQGGQSDRGAMGNIIIDEDYNENTTYLTLHSEGGDQWLVINNLLLMRDCDTGDFVVFTRYPMQPQRADVMVALSKFGENDLRGSMNCNLEKFWQAYE